jgi:serine/threonine protein kinase
LVALRQIHGNGVIHTDIKPENVLFSDSLLRDVKLVDFGSSCFFPDRQHRHYVQSLPYRAPEVVLGLPFDTAIDIWSLGCVLCELFSGTVLFSSRSQVELLAKMIGIIGPGLDTEMVANGRYSHRFVTRDGALYERTDEGICVLYPKSTSLAARLRCLETDKTSTDFLSFVSALLQLRPENRPSAVEALRHPFIVAEDGLSP